METGSKPHEFNARANSLNLRGFFIFNPGFLQLKDVSSFHFIDF